tara:strand:+ start:3453 stop:5279 length:1827 start_codon:yes stop_codon:yes gene_type:complete
VADTKYNPAKKFPAIIKQQKTKLDGERKRWAKWARWYRSEFFRTNDEDYELDGSLGVPNYNSDEITMEQNFVYSYCDTMVANIVPPNPQVTVQPRKEDLREAAKLREMLINDCLRRNKVHEKLWKLTTRASVWPRAFMKTVWNPKRRTPIFRVIDPKNIFFDNSVEEYEDIRYIIEVTVLTRGEFEKRANGKGRKKGIYNKEVADRATFGAFPQWLKDPLKDSPSDMYASQNVYQWITIYEVYDFVSDKFFHFMDDVDEPLLEDNLPYTNLRNPYQILTFNDNLKDIGGMSDVQLIQTAQERLNEIDTLEMWHSKTSIPVMLINGGLVDDPAVLMDLLEDIGGPGEIGVIDTKARVGIGDVIGSTPIPQFSPNFSQMRARCIETIEFVLGIPAYSRGMVGQSDVATELALADTATRTRNARRQKAVYDVIAWMGEAVIALYKEFMRPDEVIPARLLDSPNVEQLTKELLVMNENERALDYDYEAVPFSAPEANRVVLLKQLERFAPVLLNNPMVNQDKLIQQLLDLLLMPNVKAEQPPPQPGMPGMTGMSPEGLPPGVNAQGVQGLDPNTLLQMMGQGAPEDTPMSGGGTPENLQEGSVSGGVGGEGV